MTLNMPQSTIELCPLCAQAEWVTYQVVQWERGGQVICSKCMEHRKPEARAWIEGWDSAIEWANG